jgi:hypothetical protein
VLERARPWLGTAASTVSGLAPSGIVPVTRMQPEGRRSTSTVSFASAAPVVTGAGMIRTPSVCGQPSTGIPTTPIGAAVTVARAPALAPGVTVRWTTFSSNDSALTTGA